MKRNDRLTTLFLTLLTALSPATPALADPCGMVPPIWLGDGAPITRVGVQKTYVFYKDGLETLVLRPGFSGKVEEFGMLIPFPSPPAMRKVGEDVFAHLAAAVDPPEVVVDLRQNFEALRCCDMAMPSAAKEAGLMLGRGQKRNEVTVLSREAVGMYEVAVLDAGSAEALKRWMDDHGFRYPTGMDATCEEYIAERWCFVAVRARVGQKSASDPRPGMRDVDTSLPEGVGFDGHVQAMGFRFRTDEFVVPMRLSAFNPGELRNVMYILTDGPQRVANLPEGFVVRQIPGWTLLGNVTDPLPLRVLGGNLEDIPTWRLESLPTERDPLPRSGIARDLFASDLLALSENRLVHPHEETEKTLLEIAERLGMRSPSLDALHREAIRVEREAAVAATLEQLRSMTLTVVDGDFPRDVLARENLTFGAFAMPRQENDARLWDAKHLGPAPVQTGSLDLGTPPSPPSPLALAAGLFTLLALAALVHRRHAALTAVTAAAVAGVTIAATPVAPVAPVAPGAPGAPGAPNSPPVDAQWRPAPASDRSQSVSGSEDRILELVEQLAYPIESEDGVRVLVACGPDAIPRLIEEALSGSDPVSRGWSIVALTDIGGDAARDGLARIEQSGGNPLVRAWALAAQVQLAEDTAALLPISQRCAWDPNLERPVRKRWLELLSAATGERRDVAVAHALDALSSGGNLQQGVLPSILALGKDPLVLALTTAPSTGARNMAAACLATVAGQGEPGVARAVLDAYRFDAAAETTTWEGGPLFVPSLSWNQEDARELTRHLVSWMVWCDARGRSGEHTQLHNNLRSLGLAAAAGYESPGWQEVDVVRWLVTYGKAFGARELEKLLAEQDLDEDPRYRSAFAELDPRSQK